LRSVERNGYDPDWFLEPVDKYKCGICLSVWRGPTELPCEHIYCLYCLLQANDKKCPECRQTFKEDEIQISLFANKEIRGLKIKCPNECGIEGLIIGKDENRIIQHLDQECKQRKLMDCINLGCEEKIVTADFPQHITLKCQYRVIQCSACQQSILYLNKTKHDKEECEQRLIECDICHEIMPYKNLRDHQNYFSKCANFGVCPNVDDESRHFIDIRKIDEHLGICEYGVIPCKYCSYSCRQKEMKEHESEFTKEHFDKLLRKVEEHEVEIQSLKRQRLEEKKETEHSFKRGDTVLIKYRRSNQWYKAFITDTIGNRISWAYTGPSFPPNTDPLRIRTLSFEESKNDIKRPSIDGPFYIGEKILVSTSYSTSDIECEIFNVDAHGMVTADSISSSRPHYRLCIPSDEITTRIKRQASSG